MIVSGIIFLKRGLEASKLPPLSGWENELSALVLAIQKYRPDFLKLQVSESYLRTEVVSEAWVINLFIF